VACQTLSLIELLKELNWPFKDDSTPVRDAMQFLESAKDNYWTGDKMVDHTIQIAIPIFKFVFPGCEVLLAFDNALLATDTPLA